MLKATPVVAALLAAAPGAQPQTTPDAAMALYAKPGNAVRLRDRRRINLTCIGRGSPAVILTAGAGEWSATWSKVQPAIAARTRACAWDRAGFGLSDASIAEQTTEETVRDLERALGAARVGGPYVLVGHSLGSYESLRFADRHRGSVVGMVLVDPSIPDQAARFARVAPAIAAAEARALADGVAIVRGCAAATRAGTLRRGKADPTGCLSYPAATPQAVGDALARRDADPRRFDTVSSFLAAIPADGRRLVDPRRRYDAMPLVVLTAGKPPWISPAAAASFRAEGVRRDAEWMKGHDELAALSTRGQNRTVTGSGHYVHRERPDVVTAAIGEVLDAADDAANALHAR